MCKRLFTTTYYLQLPTKSTTYNYLSTVTLHNLFTLYTFDNIGAGLCMVRIGKGGYLNVPYDIRVKTVDKLRKPINIFFLAPPNCSSSVNTQLLSYFISQRNTNLH